MFSLQINRLVRFLFCGCLNTGITYLIFLSLDCFLAYQVAYFIAYVSGIVIAYLLNSILVFNVELSLKKISLYPCIYIVQYIVSAIILGSLVEQNNIPELIAPVLVAVIVVPLTYLLNRCILISNVFSLH